MTPDPTPFAKGDGLDLADIEAEHQPYKGDGDLFCGSCCQPWPCDARRLLDGFKDLIEIGCEMGVKDERARIWEDIDAEDTIDGRIHRDRIRAIVEGKPDG